MKHHRNNILRSAILWIVLLAGAIPYEAFAQTAQAAADALAGSILLTGVFRGKGSFDFEGDRITYRHEPNPAQADDDAPVDDTPTDVEVNGKPWNDLSKPFSLGFATQYDPPAIIGTKADNDDPKLYLTYGDPLKKFTILINEKGDPVHYSVRIGSTENVRKFNQIAREVLAKTRDITVAVDGNNGDGAFVFEGNTIVYRAKDGGRGPDHASVNGMPWNYTDRPFELDFIPDFEADWYLTTPAGLTAKKPADKNKFELDAAEVHSDPAHAKQLWFNLRILIKENGVPRNEIPMNPPLPNLPNDKPVVSTNVPAVANGPMAFPAFREPTKGKEHPDFALTEPAEATQFKQERKVVIRGTVDQQAGFRVKGSTLSYMNYTGRVRILPYSTIVEGSEAELFGGKFASGVTVDGKAWSDLTRPYPLNLTLAEPAAKHVAFHSDFCEFEYVKYDNMLEIKISNCTETPAPFEITLWMEDAKTAAAARTPAPQTEASATPSGIRLQPGAIPAPANPFVRRVDDGPTDGKDHPNYHMTTPVEAPGIRANRHAVVDLSARVDRQAGFRLDGTSLRYQNYVTPPEKPSDPVLFGGKFPEDVSVNEEKWPDLLRPFPYTVPLTSRGGGRTTPYNPAFDTQIHLMPGGCEVTLVEHGKSLEVIATNRKEEPARFKFTLRNGDRSSDRDINDDKARENDRKRAEQAARNRRLVEAGNTGSTDGKANPASPTIAPAETAQFGPERKLVIRGTVDLICGFQIKGNTLSYLNSSATSTGGFAVSGNVKLTFDGQYASGVTVNGNAWSNLNRPFTMSAPLTEHAEKNVTFKGESCGFTYRKSGDAVEFFVRNYDKNRYQDKPSQFEIVVFFADSTGGERNEP